MAMTGMKWSKRLRPTGGGIDKIMGTVYLLHFSKRLYHAGHYLGYTEDLEERLGRHKAGNGARLLEVIMEAGITWELARTWEGNRDLECRLKRQHNGPRLCPICQERRKVQ